MSTPSSVCSSTAGNPQLMGVMPSNCGSCDLSDAPQHELLRRALLSQLPDQDLVRAANDKLVRCPYLRCSQVCGFMPLHPLGQTLHLDNSFYDTECIEKIRNQPEVMNNLIGFTRDEAIVTFQHIYSMFEDQIMDPTAPGGRDSFGANVSFNPFYRSPMNELMAAPKMITTLLELEEDLIVVLARLLYMYTIRHYQSELALWGTLSTDEQAVVEAACDNYNPIRHLKENWTDIIRQVNKQADS